MSADTNIKTIQTLYEAFGRGDVDAILGDLTDDVDWAADGPAERRPGGKRPGGDRAGPPGERAGPVGPLRVR